jgi:predicted NAD-dependent protein-ADP-ribosyltransferase YbiA (DUF1768 family)
MTTPAHDAQLLEDLCLRFNAGETLEYVFFWGHQVSKHGVTASCFSQWYGAPFVVEGQRYLTAEHFMMAEKAALFGDQATRELVLQAPHPGQFLKQTCSRVIVEASPVDRVWGIGLAQDDAKAHNPNRWRGLNLLGFALMQVRDDV